jgi:hypothetical protein
MYHARKKGMAVLKIAKQNSFSIQRVHNIYNRMKLKIRGRKEAYEIYLHSKEALFVSSGLTFL